MSRIEKLDLMGISSLAAVTAALLLGWIATPQNAHAQGLRTVRDNPLTLTQDGRMKLTVVAARHEPVTLLADGRMKLTVVAERSQEVALTEDGRMKLTVTATPAQAIAASPAARRHS